MPLFSPLTNLGFAFHVQKLLQYSSTLQHITDLQATSFWYDWHPDHLDVPLTVYPDLSYFQCNNCHRSIPICTHNLSFKIHSGFDYAQPPELMVTERSRSYIFSAILKISPNTPLAVTAAPAPAP